MYCTVIHYIYCIVFQFHAISTEFYIDTVHVLSPYNSMCVFHGKKLTVRHCSVEHCIKACIYTYDSVHAVTEIQKICFHNEFVIQTKQEGL